MQSSGNKTNVTTFFSVPLRTLILSCFIFLTTSCSNDAHYEEFREIDSEAWHMDDTKEYIVDINDTTAAYRLIFTIRNTTDYAYSNLYMFFNIVKPDESIVRDTIECLLADRYGHWLGKGVGKIRENRFLIKENHIFTDAGEYKFTLEQAMRDEVLEGIADVGLRIEKVTSPQ
jgi:gliding motility-associated lipoprotein GldH